MCSSKLFTVPNLENPSFFFELNLMNLRTRARVTTKNEVVALKKLTTDRVLVPLKPLYTWI